MIEEPVGSLVVSLRLVGLGRIGRGRWLKVARGQVDLEVGGRAHGLQHREHAVANHADLLVIADENTRLVTGPQHIRTEEARVVRDVEQAQQGGREVELGDECLDAAGLDVARRPDEERDLVLAHLELALAGDGGAVVGDDDEDRVLEPGLGPRRLEEGADGVVGVGHAALATAQARIDPTRRPGVGPVVGRRHDEVMEGLAGGEGPVCLGHRPRKGILVARAPGIGEGRLHTLARLRRLVDHPVAIGTEEVVHVVEESIAPVDERRVVALRGEHRAERAQVLAAGAAQDGLPGNRGHGQRQRLHAAHGARAARIAATEPEGLARDAVEVRRQPLLRMNRVAVAAKELGAQALHGDLDDVQPASRSGGLDAAQHAVARRGERGLALGGELGPQGLHRGLKRGVETGPLELVGPEGREEGVLPVLAELGVVGVGPARLEVAHVTQARGQALADRGVMPDQRPLVRATDAVGDAQQREEEGDEQGGGAPGGDAVFGVAGPGLPETQVAQEDDNPGDDRRDAEQDERQRVRLDDVFDDLDGVDEVIDGDEVETHLELVPEEDLGHLPEDEEPGAETPGDDQHPAPPAGGRVTPERGRQAGVGQREPRRHQQVEPEPRQEGGEGGRPPGDGLRAGEEQSEPQHGAESDIGQCQEQGATLATADHSTKAFKHVNAAERCRCPRVGKCIQPPGAGGTGSSPDPPQGWQRQIRRQASQPPRITP